MRTTMIMPVFLMLSALSFAQDITIAPSPVCLLKNFTYINSDINVSSMIYNTTADTLIIRWKRISTIYPGTWMSYVCDGDSCYSENTDSADFILYPMSSDTMNVHFVSDTNFAQGAVTLQFYDISGKSFDTVTNIYAANILSGKTDQYNGTNIELGCGDSLPLKVTFLTNASYLWLPGNGLTDFAIHNPSAYPVKTTQYNIAITDTIGCIYRDSVSITVDTLLRPGFKSDKIVAAGDSFQVNFLDTSINAQSWKWDFGDGDTSIVQHPQHTFAGSVNYNVCLTISNSCSSNDSTLCISVAVGCNLPVASFNSLQDTGLSVVFTDTSIGSSSWFWNIEDSALSTSQNYTHTFDSAGTYKICMVASNDCGFDTLCKNITVVPDTINSTYQIENKPQIKLAAYPNPFSFFTYIETIIPENIEHATLIITNIYGKRIKEYHIKSGHNKLTVTAYELPAGAYFCTLKAESVLPEKMKIVVIKL